MLTLEHCGLCGWEPHYDGSAHCSNTRCPQHNEHSDDIGWNEYQQKLRAFVDGLRRTAFEAGSKSRSAIAERDPLRVNWFTHETFDQWDARQR